MKGINGPESRRGQSLARHRLLPRLQYQFKICISGSLLPLLVSEIFNIDPFLECFFGGAKVGRRFSIVIEHQVGRLPVTIHCVVDQSFYYNLALRDTLRSPVPLNFDLFIQLLHKHRT